MSKERQKEDTDQKTYQNQTSRQNSQVVQSSFLSSHPHLTKIIKANSSPIKKSQPPKLTQEQIQQIRDQLITKQHQLFTQLANKVQKLENSNKLLENSLKYYSPQQQKLTLQSQYEKLKKQNHAINQMIEQCQKVEENTTPEEYFLFKKKQRFDSFNQALDQLYQEIAQERQQLATFIRDAQIQKNQLFKEITKLEKQISPQTNTTKFQQNRKKRKQSNTLESKLNFNIDQIQSEFGQDKLKGQFKGSQHSVLVSRHEEESDSGSSVDYEQLNILKEEYKELLQTVQVLSQNKEIMTTQLFNNIQSIQDGLNNYYQNQKSKLFRDISSIKQELDSMPFKNIPQPSQIQLQYDIQPLISDYKNKLTQISHKLSTDLKNITIQLLQPLQWQNINIESYLSLNEKKNKEQKAKKEKRQNTMKQYEKLQSELKKESEEVSILEAQLQEIMSDTMVYKQKQHDLQLAINNMRKLIGYE